MTILATVGMVVVQLLVGEVALSLKAGNVGELILVVVW